MPRHDVNLTEHKIKYINPLADKHDI